MLQKINNLVKESDNLSKNFNKTIMRMKVMKVWRTNTKTKDNNNNKEAVGIKVLISQEIEFQTIKTKQIKVVVLEEVKEVDLEEVKEVD